MRTTLSKFNIYSLVLLLVCVVAIGAAPLSAQTTSWIDSAGGSFSAPTNWSNGVPDSNTTANFGLASTYDVNVFGGRNVRDLNIENGDVSFLGSNSSITMANDDVTIDGAVARMLGVNLNNFNVLNVGSDSQLILNDSITTGGNAVIGSEGNGVASLEINGATSTTRLELNAFVGIGTSGLGGTGGTGILSVSNGGQLRINREGSPFFLGQSNGNSTLSLSGEGTSLVAPLRAFDIFAGEFLVADGAIASTQDVRFYFNETRNSATVTGLGSVWTAEDIRLSSSDLNVLDGGRLVADSIRSQGGNLIYSNATIVSEEIDNGGSMFFQSGSSQISGDVLNRGFDSGGRVIQVDSGAEALFLGNVDNSRADYQLAADAQIEFRGGFRGSAEFFGDGDALMNTELRPNGLLSFEGNLAFGSDLTTFIELGGNGLEEFDRFEIGNDLLLDGILDVSMINDFLPELGDEFLIFDVDGTLSGQFIGLDEGSLIGSFGGQNLFISYSGGDGNDVTVFATSAVPEPTSGAVLMLLMLGSVARRRRRTCSM